MTDDSIDDIIEQGWVAASHDVHNNYVAGITTHSWAFCDRNLTRTVVGLASTNAGALDEIRRQIGVKS